MDDLTEAERDVLRELDALPTEDFRSEFASTHAKCLAHRTAGGRTDICRRSKGHTASADPERRKHYDPSSEQRWTDEET